MKNGFNVTSYSFSTSFPLKKETAFSSCKQLEFFLPQFQTDYVISFLRYIPIIRGEISTIDVKVAFTRYCVA